MLFVSMRDALDTDEELVDEVVLFDHTISLLSFPPLASWFYEKDHFNPHTYCLCPISLVIESSLLLISRNKIFLSLEPNLRLLKKFFLFKSITCR